LATTWTWVRTHPGWTILIVLAAIILLQVLGWVLMDLGGSSPGNGEGEIIQQP
jgi:hypothetical protein